MTGERERPRLVTEGRTDATSTTDSVTPTPIPVKPRLCCPPSEAWTWVSDLTADALDVDADSQRFVAGAVEHYLRVVRRQPVKVWGEVRYGQ